MMMRIKLALFFFLVGGLPIAAVQQTKSVCQLALAKADQNKDSRLGRNFEYVLFVNLLSGDLFGSATFSELPQPLRSTFDGWKGRDDKVNLLGESSQLRSRHHQTPLATFCAQVQHSIARISRSSETRHFRRNLVGNVFSQDSLPAYAGSELIASTATQPKAYSMTKQSGETDRAVSFSTCRISLTVSDTDRDNVLSETEYIGFINRMSGGEYLSLTYDMLPQALKTNYVDLEDSDGVFDISGASPYEWPSASPIMQQTLETICSDTQIALATAAAPVEQTPSVAPTAAPSASWIYFSSPIIIEYETTLLFSNLDEDNPNAILLVEAFGEFIQEVIVIEPSLAFADDVWIDTVEVSKCPNDFAQSCMIIFIGCDLIVASDDLPYSSKITKTLKSLQNTTQNEISKGRLQKILDRKSPKNNAIQIISSTQAPKRADVPPTTESIKEKSILDKLRESVLLTVILTVAITVFILACCVDYCVQCCIGIGIVKARGKNDAVDGVCGSSTPGQEEQKTSSAIDPAGTESSERTSTSNKV